MKNRIRNDAKYIRAALTWNSGEKSDCDLDLSAFLLNEGGKVRGDSDLIFYNNAFSPEGALVYGGDNRSGSGEGMDETILVSLDLIPKEVSRVVFCVTIADDNQAQSQSLANTVNAKFTANIVSDPYDKDGEGLCEVNVSLDNFNNSGAAVFELSRSGDVWTYNVTSDNVKGGLSELCHKFALEIE